MKSRKRIKRHSRKYIGGADEDIDQLENQITALEKLVDIKLNPKVKDTSCEVKKLPDFNAICTLTPEEVRKIKIDLHPDRYSKCSQDQQRASTEAFQNLGSMIENCDICNVQSSALKSVVNVISTIEYDKAYKLAMKTLEDMENLECNNDIKQIIFYAIEHRRKGLEQLKHQNTRSNSWSFSSFFR